MDAPRAVIGRHGRRQAPSLPRRRATATLGALMVAGVARSAAARAAAPGSGTVYLTLDTGNMAEAERIARILARQAVPATFFLANERTPRGDHALEPGWAGFWRERAAEGHAFGSHTFDHVYLRGVEHGADGSRRFVVRPQFGTFAGRTLRWSEVEFCSELRRVDERFREFTGRGLDPYWRAPGGRAPAAAIEAARRCGFAHVGWTPAGFLGDELSSQAHPNDRLLADSLARIGDGDILLAHLGIWSRHDPYAPMLDPLIAGLKSRGLRFATIDRHPLYRAASLARAGVPATGAAR